MMRLILASQSPRRRQLIRLLGYPVEVCVADVDESSVTHPDPAVNVVETAVLKANAILANTTLPTAPKERDALIIAADTIVALEGQMLGKPADANTARQMLTALRNRDHFVYTGLVILDIGSGQMTKQVDTATVTMRDYSPAEIDAYIATGDPMDKAGAYAIQHPQFRPVAALHGCYTAVMGLGMCQLLRTLDGLGQPRQADLKAIHLAHQNYPCPIFPQLLD